MYRMIIIDDDMQLIQIVEKYIDFQSIGILYLGSATDGQKGYEMILKLKPDIVLSDISMPTMSGLEMIRRVRENGIASKFVIISGHDSFEYTHDAIRLEVSEYLLKPIFPPDIEEALKTIVGKLNNEAEYITNNEQSDSDDVVSDSVSKSKRTKGIVTEAIAYIHDNYMNNITLNSVSKELHVSPNHLRNMFVKKTGMTFNKYLTNHRMMIAEQLLASNEYTVYEVCDLVGYKDLHSFRKLFKEHFGKLPSELLRE